MTEFFQEFKEFRKILCVCPCCGEIVRLSDLHIKLKGKIAKTWLDEFESKEKDFQQKVNRFEDKKDRLRSLAVERGRAAAEVAINNAISPTFRKLKLDPFDVKSILNPIDFIVFDGMNKEDSVNDIIFLSKQVQNKNLNLIRQQVKKSIITKKYDWQVARINEEGKIEFE
jgi:predicted Holliday junction resolvase-like endonuclease